MRNLQFDGRLRLFAILLTGIAALTSASPARAEFTGIDIERPGARQFVLDKANLLTEEDQKKIQTLADKLLTDKAVPIIVVTINSMADHGGKGLRIETFARLLFDQWQVGPEKVGGQDWNRGMLLLVSKGDRKARIELGSGWRRDKDIAAQKIMGEQIVPQFKKGNFSAGIVAGVEALDTLARELPRPGGNAGRPGAVPSSNRTSHGTPPAHYRGNSEGMNPPSRFGSLIVGIIVIGGIILVGMFVIGLLGRLFSGGGGGGGGYAPGRFGGYGGGGGGSGVGSFLGGAATGVLGSVLYNMLSNRSSGSSSWGGGSHYSHGSSDDGGSSNSFSDGGGSSFDSGGGYSGGSFDGGSSGGGGATGEW